MFAMALVALFTVTLFTVMYTSGEALRRVEGQIRVFCCAAGTQGL
jgi:hypothetical protein